MIKRMKMNLMMLLLSLPIFFLIFLYSNLTPTNTTANTPFSLLHSYHHLIQLSNIFILNNYCYMTNKIYLITIMKYSVSVITVIVGYTTNINDKSNIDSYLKEKYDLIRGAEIEHNDILKNKHWVYSTNKSNVFVHIESVFDIDYELKNISYFM